MLARNAVRQLPEYDTSEAARPEVRAHRNENVLGAPPHVLRAIRRLTADDIARYPGALYASLLHALARANDVSPDLVVVANGADEVLSAVIDCFARDGDNCVLMSPSFEWYARFAARSGAKAVIVPYRLRWQVEADDLVAACDPKTRVLLLGNPNNPTGELLPQSVLRIVLAALPDTVVVVDETYVEVTGETLAGELARFRNLVIVRSMSKTAALAGLRLGYALADPEITGVIRRWLQPYCVNVAAATAALAYTGCDAETARFVDRYRELVRTSLAEIACACRPVARAVFPSAANFLLVDFGARLDAVDEALRARGIVARRFSPGPIASCLRISAQPPRATAAIAEALDDERIRSIDA
jgi:histidinol-phosphate aminotransferase